MGEMGKAVFRRCSCGGAITNSKEHVCAACIRENNIKKQGFSDAGVDPVAYEHGVLVFRRHGRVSNPRGV